MSQLNINSDSQCQGNKNFVSVMANSSGNNLIINNNSSSSIWAANIGEYQEVISYNYNKVTLSGTQPIYLFFHPSLLLNDIIFLYLNRQFLAVFFIRLLASEDKVRDN